MIIRPLLAATIEDFKVLRFPLFASYKLDGIRAIVHQGQLYSRSLKPIRNKFTQERFKGLPEGYDGELCVGSITDANLMQKTSSGVMSIEGEPDVSFQIFDLQSKLPFSERNEKLKEWAKSTCFPHSMLVEQFVCATIDDLVQFESEAVEKGFEGVIARSGSAPYKHGRSTMKEQYLMKLKRFKDDEAFIIGFEEQLHNANEAFLDERGYTKRSGHQANLIGKGTLGALVVRDKEGREFNVGSGFDDALRRVIWGARELYLGRPITFKHFAVTGVKDKPRQPIFKGFREDL